MEKPLVIARSEFVDNVCNLINESGLPAFVMREVLERITKTLIEMEQAELEATGKAWIEAQKEAKDDERP